jgi:hypothetical protein
VRPRLPRRQSPAALAQAEVVETQAEVEQKAKDEGTASSALLLAGLG